MSSTSRPGRVTDRRSPNPRQTISRLQEEWRALSTRPDLLVTARQWPLLIEPIGAEPTGTGASAHHSGPRRPFEGTESGRAADQPLRSLDEVLVATGYRPPSFGPTVDAVSTAQHGRDSREAACAAAARDGEWQVDSPDAAEPDDRAAPCDAADSVLLALVTIAGSDELAARVVLQRLLPGLSAIARRHGRCMEEHLLAFDELLSVAWWVIRRFPVERRRRHIAASLLRDCEHQAFRREHRRLLVHEYTPPELLDRAIELDTVDQEPLLEVLELIGEARMHHLHDGDLELLGALLGAGLLREAAAELRVSVRTVRNHRNAVVHRLRAALAA